MKKIILLFVLAISQFTLFADSCNLIFQLEDLYGDGWNGAAIVIKQNDVEVASVSLLSGSEDEVLVDLEAGETMFYWVEGLYDFECGFTIINPAGEVIYEHEMDVQEPNPGLLFTYNHQCEQPSSIISGTVTAAIDNSPLADATVSFMAFTENVVVTDQNGFYSIELVEGISYDVVVEKTGFNPYFIDDFVVPVEDETIDFQLTNPVFEISVDNISEVVENNNVVTVDATITNTGNGPLYWETCISYPDKAYNSMAYTVNHLVQSNYPIATKFPLNDPAQYVELNDGSVSSFDMLSDGDFIDGHWYTTDPNTVYVHEIDMVTGTSTAVLSHGILDIYGISYNPVDGQVYIKGENQFYTMDMQTGAATPVFSMPSPTGAFTITNDGRFITIDIDNDRFVEFNPTTSEETVIAEFGFDAIYLQGIATDRETNMVYWSAFTSEDWINYDGFLYKLNLYTDELEYIGELDGNMVALTIPSEFRWLDLSSYSGILQPGESQNVSVMLDGSWAESGSFEANLLFNNDSAETPVIVPVEMIIGAAGSMAGDANGDGEVNVADINSVIEYLFTSGRSFNFENADVNIDGVINVLDIMGIVGIIYSQK